LRPLRKADSRFLAVLLGILGVVGCGAEGGMQSSSLVGTTPSTSISGGGTIAPTPTPTPESHSNTESFPQFALLRLTSRLPGDGYEQTLSPRMARFHGSSQINPYYSDLAAIGLTHDPLSDAPVQRWMQWYVNHLNWPDRWGLYGTMTTTMA